ncbi:MAG: ABC transporter ATP-binding protein [Pseudomonadota bacterium]
MLKFEGVGHRYGQTVALTDISLTAPAGEITCLVGPSGCGKTTLLRLAAGLMRLQAGRIALNDTELATSAHCVPPEAREVGLVFQEGALFPHLTVARNVAFGLPAADRPQRVAQQLEEVGLGGFEDRYPDSLSGGQRQRVALARAMAPQPRALLFDEPFASLDIQLRRTLRTEARRLVREHGIVGMVVTHDPEEVLAMADRVVVLTQGQVVQQGTPRALYERPATLQVAEMFGNAQPLSAVLGPDGIKTAFGLWPAAALQSDDLPQGPLQIAVRPYDLELHPGGAVRVTDVRLADGFDEFVLSVPDGDDTLVAAVPLQAGAGSSAFQPGNTVSVVPRAGSVFAAVKAP